MISFNPDWLHLDNVATSLSLSLAVTEEAQDGHCTTQTERKICLDKVYPSQAKGLPGLFHGVQRSIRPDYSNPGIANFPQK